VCTRAYARESIKTTNDDPVVRALTKLEEVNPTLYQFFYNLINKIDTSAIKIAGVVTPPQKILNTIIPIITNPNFEQLLATAKTESEQPGVREPMKYAVSVLYNLAKSITEPQPCDFSQREYTEEFCNSLYDTLDDISLD